MLDDNNLRMKILLLSNQGMVEPFVGNPIMIRYRDSLYNDNRIEEVRMIRCKHPFKVIKELRNDAKQVDLIHIHFGGLYALVTWILLFDINKPKIITFHGTDIHAKAIKTSKSLLEKIRIKINQYSSFISILLYDKCGFVAEEMEKYLPFFIRKICKKKFFIQLLGVDYQLFHLMDKISAQQHLGLKHGKYILFSDVHNTTIKRRDIAQKIVDELPKYDLLLMCGVNSKEVPYYINASEAILLTSDQEGSPNIIREALSLNKPVFSVDVGDASKQLFGLKNSCIIPRNPNDAALIIIENISKEYIDNTRDMRRNILDFCFCSKKVIDIYESLLYM